MLFSMRRPLLLTIWLACDIAVFIGAYALAYVTRVGLILSTDFPLHRFLAVTILVVPFWLGVLMGSRTFSLMRRQMTLRTFAYITYACLIGTSLFALAYFFIFGLFFSRLLLAFALGFSILGTWLCHLTIGWIGRGMLRRSPPAYPTLIIGATREAATLIRSLTKNRSPLTPVAILDGRGTSAKELEGIPVRGKLNLLEETIQSLKITHLVQCSDLEQSINLLSACRQRGITYLLLPSVLGIIERDERVELLEGRPVTVVRPTEAWWMWFFS
jgi:FlaA1/EpsC-like NDP-sugar epimerase